MPLIRAEIVKNHEDMAIGLMGRHALPKNAGMLFDFGKDQPLSFWMKNTYIPLQIAFIDSKGVVKRISSMAPLSTHSIRSNGDCRYALEVNEGWFDENNIRTGATVEIPGAQSGQKDKSTGPEAGKPDDKEVKSPELVIEQSFKDILKAANQFDVPLVIGYVVDGMQLDPEQISPPFMFGKTATDDYDGLLNVQYSNKSAHPKSFIIDGRNEARGKIKQSDEERERRGNTYISYIKDVNGNPILNASRIEELSRSTPNKVEDDMSAKGKLY